MTESEKVVVSLCQKSFLSLWTMANPVGKEPAKELCDALVVFDNTIIIISVKEIMYKETEDGLTGKDRWNKSAIEKSIKQLKGAKRYLATQKIIHSKEYDVVFNLPENDTRRCLLLTVSLGANRKIPISIPFDGSDFVHFIDESCLAMIFEELDTVSDFIEYLVKKETLFVDSNKLIIGNEENLIGYYLWNNRSFPSNYDVLIFEDDIWENINTRPEYKAKKEADKVSYFWDKIIEEFINMRDPELVGIFGSFDEKNQNIELALRTLAKECRFSRRVLSQSFIDFHKDKKIASRVLQSFFQENVFYVFLKKPTNYDRNDRQIELLARCMIVRDKINSDSVIIGVATEDNFNLGHSFDLLYYKKSDWTEDDKKATESAMKNLELFKSPRSSFIHADEYPNDATTT